MIRQGRSFGDTINRICEWKPRDVGGQLAPAEEMQKPWWNFWGSDEPGQPRGETEPNSYLSSPGGLNSGGPSQSPLLAAGAERGGGNNSNINADSYSITQDSMGCEVAISPKSIQMLEEAEVRTARRARRRRYKNDDRRPRATLSERCVLNMMRAIRMVLALVAIVLVALISLLAMLYPRDTRFNIDSFDVDVNNSTYYEGDQLMTNWISKVSIDNGNFYPISIREIDLTVFLDSHRDTPIGKGRGRNLYFSARGKSACRVDFQMPVYAPSSGKPNLIGECMSRDRVELYIRSEVDLNWTHWTGRRIPIEFTVTVDCKLPSVGGLAALRPGRDRRSG